MLKAKYQYLIRPVSTRGVNIGSLVCGCQKKISAHVKAYGYSEATAIEKVKLHITTAKHNKLDEEET
ncbi:hypothetical protein [Vibrio hepatarius]|uniref:hypothetical protein n=1 Tax=Vibrio hepatarius TaxID=171383 RepID=UPI001C0A0C70|nr:hypothetical protein [Vibrio hepatarius]MBU2898371.1 hypothetical protein [Vibrio hepatarius]